jgi:exosome complex exonuclease DIS3/RRP44
MGFEIRVNTNQALAESLDHAVDPKNPESNTILRMMATRCMTQALYFPAGTVPEGQEIHYGLAIPKYTHFTSPIRRYADIIVHRQLAVTLDIFKRKNMPKMFQRAYLINVSDEMNRRYLRIFEIYLILFRNRLAQRAARASVVLNAQYLLEGKPAEDDGFVTQLKENGVSVSITLPDILIEMFLDRCS